MKVKRVVVGLAAALLLAQSTPAFAQVSQAIPAKEFSTLLDRVVGGTGIESSKADYVTKEEAVVMALSRVVKTPYSATLFGMTYENYPKYSKEALDYLAVGQELGMVNLDSISGTLQWEDAAILLQRMKKVNTLSVYPELLDEKIAVRTENAQGKKEELIAILPRVPSWVLQDYLQTWHFEIADMAVDYDMYPGIIGLCEPNEKKIVLDVDNVTPKVLLHEIGHYFHKTYVPAGVRENLYEKEGESLGGLYRSYSASNSNEFFADAFTLYLLNDTKKLKGLQKAIPETYDYLEMILKQTEGWYESENREVG